MITCLQVSQHVIMTALIGTTVLLRDPNCITDVTGNIVPFLVYCMFTVEFTYLLPPFLKCGNTRGPTRDMPQKVL